MIKLSPLRADWHAETMSVKSSSTVRYKSKGVEVGLRIKELRDRKGWTQAALAHKIGVSDNAITQYETGRAVPKPEKLQGLSEHLGTTMEWLLTGGYEDEVCKAQTTSELAILREMRKVPIEHQPTALAAIQGIAARYTKHTKS